VTGCAEEQACDPRPGWEHRFDLGVDSGEEGGRLQWRIPVAEPVEGRAARCGISNGGGAPMSS
jgi:hypothetical protein